MPSARSPSSLTTKVEAVGREANRLLSTQPTLVPERLSGVHNPWGFGATITDAWLFLDLCEDPEVVRQINAILGPDVILFDSALHLRAASYLAFVAAGREGRYWPIVPLAGALALFVLGPQPAAPVFFSLAESELVAASVDPSLSLYVARYFPATSRFERNPRHETNWRAMEEQPLINLTNRPLWQVSGSDQAGNDFITGFAATPPRWAGSAAPGG